MPRPMPRLFLIRHGETEWSLNGKHTGVTDIPLTAHGEQLILDRAASAVGPGKLLDPSSLCHILVSPRQRAQRTFALLFSGLPELPSHETVSDVQEWNYGDYEGLLSSDIKKIHPEWDIFLHGCPGGESVEQMSARMDRVISKVRQIHRQYLEEGVGRRDVMIVAHGHFTRCFIARWLDAPIVLGQYLSAQPAGISMLSYAHHSMAEPTLEGLNLYAFCD